MVFSHFAVRKFYTLLAMNHERIEQIFRRIEMEQEIIV